MNMQLEPHDLLWGMTCADLLDARPDWVDEVIQRGDPVVVRRAAVECGMIAVGIRGFHRHQRFAATLEVHRINRFVKPEQLQSLPCEQFPHLAEIMQKLQACMQKTPWNWGYTGSMGFELATGRSTLTAQSDIDMLIRVPDYFSKSEAMCLWNMLEQTQLPLDIQLQTPLGGIALKEWAHRTGKVLLKCNDGAVLTHNPWQH